MTDAELILHLQDKIKTLELDVQYELHQKNLLEQKYNELLKKIKIENNIDINN
jgi:hypothetical protein